MGQSAVTGGAGVGIGLGTQSVPAKDQQKLRGPRRPENFRRADVSKQERAVAAPRQIGRCHLRTGLAFFGAGLGGKGSARDSPRAAPRSPASAGRSRRRAIFGVQIVAPRSIKACAWQPGRLSGVSRAASAFSRGLGGRAAARSPRGRGVERHHAFDILPSRNGGPGRSKAMEAMAGTAVCRARSRGSASSPSSVSGENGARPDRRPRHRAHPPPGGGGGGGAPPPPPRAPPPAPAPLGGRFARPRVSNPAPPISAMTSASGAAARSPTRGQSAVKRWK